MRKEWKKNARGRLKKFYWVFVLTCLLMGIAGMEYTSSLSGITTDTMEQTEKLTRFDTVLLDIFEGNIAKGQVESDQYMAAQKKEDTKKLGIIALGHSRGVFAQLVNGVSSGAILMSVYQALRSIGAADTLVRTLMIIGALIFVLVVRVLIMNTFAIGVKRYYMEARRYDHVPAGRFLYLYRTGKAVNVALVMLLKDIYLALWTLTIVGLFIKGYAYKMVPYILAENPSLKPKEAITLSRRMMKGHKWEAFKLNLSFIGWNLLESLTFGLSGMLYSNPYHEATLAEYYVYVRDCAFANGIEGIEVLNDRYLYEVADEALLEHTYGEFKKVLEEADQEVPVHTGFRGFLENVLGLTPRYDEDERRYEIVKAIQSYVRDVRFVMKGEMYPSRLYPIKISEKTKHMGSTHYDRHYSVLSMIFMFLTMCFIGWSWEVSLHLITDAEFVNRGVLHGPWLPIYGTGGALILIVLNKLRKNPLVLFGSAVVLCGILEYYTHYFLQKAHNGQVWWDYTGYFLNINGRICAEGLLIFGLGGVAIVYLLAPFLDNQFRRIPIKIAAPLGIALMAIFVADDLYSRKHPNAGKGITDYAEAETESGQPTEAVTEALTEAISEKG